MGGRSLFQKPKSQIGNLLSTSMMPWWKTPQPGSFEGSPSKCGYNENSEYKFPLAGHVRHTDTWEFYLQSLAPLQRWITHCVYLNTPQTAKLKFKHVWSQTLRYLDTDICICVPSSIWNTEVQYNTSLGQGHSAWHSLKPGLFVVTPGAPRGLQSSAG